jgi:hypothetical protein
MILKKANYETLLFSTQKQVEPVYLLADRTVGSPGHRSKKETDQQSRILRNNDNDYSGINRAEIDIQINRLKKGK